MRSPMNEEQPLWSWGSRAKGTTGELGRDFVLFLAFDIEDWTAGADTLGLGTSKQEEKLSLRDPMIFLPFLSLGSVAKGFRNLDWSGSGGV